MITDVPLNAALLVGQAHPCRASEEGVELGISTVTLNHLFWAQVDRVSVGIDGLDELIQLCIGLKAPRVSFGGEAAKGR